MEKIYCANPDPDQLLLWIGSVMMEAEGLQDQMIEKSYLLMIEVSDALHQNFHQSSFFFCVQRGNKWGSHVAWDQCCNVPNILWLVPSGSLFFISFL